MVSGAFSRLPLTELARRTVRDTIDDDCPALAAQLSYYLCLAFFPALLFVLALSSFFSLRIVTDDVARALGPFVSPQLLALVQDQMRRLSEANDGGLLSVGVLGALWGSSSALVAIVSAVNRAYDLPETRPWWRVRLTAGLLTLALAAIVIAAGVLVLAGPAIVRIFGFVDSNLALWFWSLARWPAAFALVAFGVGLIYNYAPNADQDWLWVTPGAIVATILWLVSSLAFKFYLDTFTDYEGSYGAVGGIIILLLWLYLSGLGILIGAELNAELEHAMPYGAAALTDTASGRRVIGPRAARLFERQSAARPGRVEPASPLPSGIRPAPASIVPGLTFTALVLALRVPRRILRKAW
jgi:membrane protein